MVTWNHLVQHNEQYHRKVLLNSFHLNGHTLGFHPQTEELEPPCTAYKQHHRNMLLNSIPLNGQILEVHPRTQTLQINGSRLILERDIFSVHILRYDERIDRVETRITARLRDQLGIAKNANEMFRIFSRFNALFVRPHIRGAIREYQTQLIQRVKDDIEALHDKFKV